MSQRTRAAEAVLTRARVHAERLGHRQVSTEHLLLGLLTVRSAAPVFDALAVDPAALWRVLDAVVRAADAPAANALTLPYGERAGRALELAAVEARELGSARVDVEHLLLGLVRERSGVAAHVLAVAGVSLESARAAARRRTGRPGRSRPALADLFRPLSPRRMEAARSARRVVDRSGADPDVVP